MTNTTLVDMRVGLSGAVPEPERLAQGGLTETEFLMASSVYSRLGVLRHETVAHAEYMFDSWHPRMCGS